MNGNFFTMQNDIFKCGLSAYEFIVYAYLVMKADRKTGLVIRQQLKSQRIAT